MTSRCDVICDVITTRTDVTRYFSNDIFRP